MNEQNYGEAIAYWYLRLNGFFIITDFTLHRPEDYRTSDADLLGIRLPHTTEIIDGNDVVYCENLISHIDLSKQCGVICEVKTGKLSGEVKDNLFRTPYVDYSINRMGFLKDNSQIKKTLGIESVYTDNNIVIIKLLIADYETDDSKNYKFISLDVAYKFIEARLDSCINIKFPDRFFLKSAFIQNLIWRLGKRRNA